MSTPPGPSRTERAWNGLGPDGRPPLVDCDHLKTDAQLCRRCVDDISRVLMDVPALLVDLAVAFRRDVRFLERGTIVRTGAELEESTLPYDDHAARARDTLLKAMERLAELLSEPGQGLGVTGALTVKMETLACHPSFPAAALALSAAVREAHDVIDAPSPPWYFGPCPDCGRDIYGARLDDTDMAARVICSGKGCTYAAHPVEHRRVQLDTGEDRMLTVSELVGAITAAGNVVTRAQIDGWIHRKLLPGGTRARSRLVNGKLTVREVHVYRLGDVRQLAELAEKRRAARLVNVE